MGTDPAAEAVQRFLEALGQDPTRAGLVGTPDRVAELYRDLLAGTDVDPADVLEVTSTEENDELILLRDVAFYSLCEHHLLPWMGKAHVGYIPNKKGEIAGLSNLARVVDICAKRLQMQERLTTQVADAVERALDPRGVIVVVEAEHLCMSMRGVHTSGHATVTSAVRGVFRENVATRAEAMAIIRGR